jgi:hypothetical protein
LAKGWFGPAKARSQVARSSVALAMPVEPIFETGANALISDVKLSRSLNTYNWFGTWGAMGLALWLLRTPSGGTWVGGVVALYADRLSFKPTPSNASLTAGLLNIDVPLGSVNLVRWRRGLVTNIIDVRHGSTCMTFRCQGAEQFARVIQNAISRLQDGASR